GVHGPAGIQAGPARGEGPLPPGLLREDARLCDRPARRGDGPGDDRRDPQGDRQEQEWDAVPDSGRGGDPGLSDEMRGDSTMFTPRKQWQLDRRTFLRGAGVSLALPWLEAMGLRSGSLTHAGEMAPTEIPRRAYFS